MPVPSQPTFSVAALTAAHNAFKATFQPSTTPGFIRIRDASDNVLVQITLSTTNTVDPATGVLNLTMPQSDTATASGTAAYGELCDSSGNPHLSLPAQAGTVPAAGAIVLSTLNIVSGADIEIIAASIG